MTKRARQAGAGGGSLGISDSEVMVRRSSIAACVTYGLCGCFLRDATSISECLHAWNACIVDEIKHKNIDQCPKCGSDLGCDAFAKLSDISCKEVRVCCQENHKFEGSILTPIPSSTTHDMEIEIENPKRVIQRIEAPRFGFEEVRPEDFALHPEAATAFTAVTADLQYGELVVALARGTPEDQERRMQSFVWQLLVRSMSSSCRHRQDLVAARLDAQTELSGLHSAKEEPQEVSETRAHEALQVAEARRQEADDAQAQADSVARSANVARQKVEEELLGMQVKLAEATKALKVLEEARSEAEAVAKEAKATSISHALEIQSLKTDAAKYCTAALEWRTVAMDAETSFHHVMPNLDAARAALDAAQACSSRRSALLSPPPPRAPLAAMSL